MDGVIFEATKPVPDGDSVWVEVTPNDPDRDPSLKIMTSNATKLDAVLAKCNAIEERLKLLEGGVTSLNVDVAGLKKDVTSLNTNVKSLRTEKRVINF